MRARDLWGAQPVRVSSVRAVRTPVRLWERTIVCTRACMRACAPLPSAAAASSLPIDCRTGWWHMNYQGISTIMTKGNHCKQQAMSRSPSVGCYARTHARTHARVRARAHTRTQTRTHSCTHEHACMQHHMAHKSQERTALMALTLCCCFKLSSQEVSWCRGRIPRACLYTGLCTHA